MTDDYLLGMEGPSPVEVEGLIDHSLGNVLYSLAIDGPSPVKVDEPPETFGPFRVAGVIGRGGMGVVYRAVHEETGQEVAVKTVRLPRRGLLQKLRAKPIRSPAFATRGLSGWSRSLAREDSPGTRWSSCRDGPSTTT